MRCSLLLAVLAACGPPAPVAPTSAPSAAETAGFDWQVRADCPLRYLVQVTKSQEMLGAQGEPPFAGPSIVTEAEVTMERDDDLVALRTKALRVAFAGEPQIRTPWISDDEHPPADVLLVEGERGFEETEGTTTMWSAAAKGGLLSLLWPPLPGTTQIGDRESWPLRLASPRAILQTEMARGAGRGKTLPPGSMPAPSEERLLTTGAVTVSELLVGPYPTVVLTGRWSEDISESIRQELPAMEGRRPLETFEATTTGVAHYDTRHEVTTDGRLLRATATRDMQIEMRFGQESAPQRHRMVERVQAHLVAACDALRATPDQAPDTPQTRALKIWGDVAEAVITNRSAAPGFAPEVVQKHGGALDATLQAYAKRYGESAVGRPAFVPTVTLRDGEVQFRRVGSAPLPELPPDSVANIHILVTLDLRGAEPGVTELLVEDASGTIGDEVLLHIDAARLVLR